MTGIDEHAAGSTVRQIGRFNEIEVPEIRDPLPVEFREKWVSPIYMKLLGADPCHEVISLWNDIDEDVVLRLLSQFDWRSKLVGSYLVALNSMEVFTSLVGGLLLRSDVCYAGKGYCVALASLNSGLSAAYIHQYLGYYLSRTDLYFDQGDAIGAVAYLDKCNGTTRLQEYLPQWNAFVEGKTGWQLQKNVDTFERRMVGLMQLIDQCRKVEVGS